MAERFAWAADVRAAMSRLPQAQRETLELAYFSDRTQSDIARLQQVPIGTVKARMARGTRALGELLTDYEHTGETTARRRQQEGGESE